VARRSALALLVAHLGAEREVGKVVERRTRRFLRERGGQHAAGQAAGCGQHRAAPRNRAYRLRLVAAARSRRAAAGHRIHACACHPATHAARQDGDVRNQARPLSRQPCHARPSCVPGGRALAGSWRPRPRALRARRRLPAGGCLAQPGPRPGRGNGLADGGDRGVDRTLPPGRAQLRTQMCGRSSLTAALPAAVLFYRGKINPCCWVERSSGTCSTRVLACSRTR
jgi:hypothetical protein